MAGQSGPVFYNRRLPLPPKPTEPDFLKHVTVRLIRDDERDAFDRALENQHSLASARLAGQTLRHVAQLDGHWVARLTFSASSRPWAASAMPKAAPPRRATRSGTARTLGAT